MISGKKVVCINDEFKEAWVHAYYAQLPKKDQIYTVRDVRMGRTDISKPGMDSATVTITLVELQNGDDPHYTDGKCELGFNSERFKEIEEVTEKEEMKEIKHIGKKIKRRKLQLA